MHRSCITLYYITNVEVTLFYACCNVSHLNCIIVMLLFFSVLL
jgi:hypothetical protein